MSRMRSRSVCVIVLAVLLTLLQGPVSLAAERIDIGDRFPEVELPAPADQAQRNYLGLSDESPFTLSQVQGKVVLVEVLNVLCPHCRKQTKPYNELYRMIEADPATRGKIKMLGVAVANSDEAIEDFLDIYSVAFPVVSDRHFKLHHALHAGATPFAIYVLRDKAGEPGVVTDTHLGTDYEMEALFAYLKDLLAMKTSEFVALQKEKSSELDTLRPPQSDDEIDRLVKEVLYEQGTNLQDFRRLALPSDRWVYTATVVRDGRRQQLFAEVTSRSAICDVCHSVHFFYLFDRTGEVLDFSPLHLTKYGNVEWDQADIDHFTARVVGRKIAGAWNFDPDIDAVSSATMTAAIIFDDLSQGQELLEELQEQGLLGE